jgi:succinate dehydrogenase / fumarate reductase iron-sulfur subunit
MSYWESFEVQLAPRLTIAEVLDRLALSPITAHRERVTPIAYTWGCAGPGCVSCMLVANGRPVPACETLVEEFVEGGGTLALEPMAKLGVVRDLLVDGSRLRETRAHLRAWLGDDKDRSEDKTAPTVPTAIAEVLSRCTRCGACVEACPETRQQGGFVGAAAIVASQLADAREGARSSSAGRSGRHIALTFAGGIHECGDAQRCLEACPAELPLDEILGQAARDALRHAFRR